MLQLIMNEYLFSMNDAIESLLIAINSSLGNEEDLQEKLEGVMYIPVKDISTKMYMKELTDGEVTDMEELLEFIRLSSAEMNEKASENYNKNSLFRKVESREFTHPLPLEESQSCWSDPSEQNDNKRTGDNKDEK